MRDELLLSKIKLAVKTLDEIDEMIDTQPEELAKIDLELSDLYHFIENENLNNDNCIKIIERIKYLRILRKSLNKEYNIERVYKNNSSKMMGNNTRPFLMNEIEKTVSNLDTEYKNRVLTEEDINELKTTTKRKRGRPPKKEVI